jgi:O-antigen ligase
MMALALSYAWVVLMLLRRFPLPAVSTFVVCTIVSVGLVMYFFADSFFDLLGRDSSLTGRTAIWAFAVDHFWDQPWIGNGYQQLGGPQFLNAIFVAFSQAIPGPESAYLELLLDVGIIGTLLFVAPMIVCVRNGFEWLKHVHLEDRAGIEFMLMTLFAVLVGGYTETGMLISTGFDGVLSFGALFALLTTPKSPEGVLRGEFRLAKYRFADTALPSR